MRTLNAELNLTKIVPLVYKETKIAVLNETPMLCIRVDPRLFSLLNSFAARIENHLALLGLIMIVSAKI